MGDDSGSYARPSPHRGDPCLRLLPARYSPEDQTVRVPAAGGPSVVRQRGYSLESVRLWVRDTDLVKRSPFVLKTLRSIWSGIDFLRVRKDRSYIHGLLFDLRGGLYSTEGMAFRIAPKQFPRSYRGVFPVIETARF